MLLSIKRTNASIMKVERPPVLLLFFLISIGFDCLQRLHADSGEFLKPIGAGWNDCCSKIVREAQACGDKQLAAYIQNWPLPDELGPTQSQVIASIDKKLLKPACLEKSS